MFSSVGVSLVDYHCLSFHVNSFSLTLLCIFSTPFMSFSYPFHVLVMSFFFPFMSFKLQEIPKSTNYTSFLLNHQFKKYLDQTLSQSGTGIPHKSPKNRLVKAVEKVFHGFSSRLSAFHFLTCAFSSVCFMFSISFSCPFMIWSWTLPQIYTQQKFSLFDFLLEKDKTKAKPTPIDLGKGRTP